MTNKHKFIKVITSKVMSCCLLLSSFFIPCTILYSQIIIGGNPPSIAITSPTNGPAYITTSSTVALAGIVSSTAPSSSLSVTWNNDRGGSGAASGTYNWSIDSIGLQPGQNVITVTVLEYFGGGSSEGSLASLTVTYIPAPTVAITAPIAGQRWSNTVFNVKGMATDFWQVGSVRYELNNDAWQNATGTTNWSATLNLTPGTNTIRAYALDTNGIASATNSVSLDFVVTNQLEIAAIGLGTIKPNYSNSWLEIGRNYSITSAPASGFIFNKWTVSTNWIGGAVVPGTKLQFMMVSNLTVQASFTETSKPALSITTPTNLKKKISALTTVKGTASDKWGVAGVWYQLNNGSWNAASTTNVWTNWITPLQLIAGTNTVKAFAMNFGGIFSNTNSVSVVSSNTFLLQLIITNTTPLKSNGLVFGLQVSRGLNGRIQVSTNLINWSTFANFVGSNSMLNFRDPVATNVSYRFYRATIP